MEIPETHREQLEIWMGDPMTRWYLEQIDMERKSFEELMGRGHTVNLESTDWTAMKTAHDSGYVCALDFCTQFDFEGGLDES